MRASKLEYWLAACGASSAFGGICGDLARSVPPHTTVHDDTWNILPWLKSARNSSKSNVYFGVIRHPDLKELCKLWVLHARLTRHVGSRSSVDGRIVAFESLSYALGARHLQTLVTDDFITAERWLCRKYKSPYRLAGYLQQASGWLSSSLSIRLNYHNRLRNPATYGRFGTDKGREEKLMPTEVIRDLLNARHRGGLIVKDRFFLSVFAICVATGFRVGELSVLPAECLLKVDGKLHVLHYPEKGGRPVPRPVHPFLAGMVEDAVGFILQTTSEARRVAQQVRRHPELDWSHILADAAALRYFVGRWAHAWTSDLSHAIISSKGAWCTKKRCFIDALRAYEVAGCNKSQAARNLGLGRNTFSDLMAAQMAAQSGNIPHVRNSKARGKDRNSWDTDSRIISVEKFQKYSGILVNHGRRKGVKEIVDKARRAQIKGDVFPSPVIDLAFEKRFQRGDKPLLKDENGKSLLYRDEALLIIQKYALSENRSTKENEFSSITDKSIIRWFSGECRSYGTGNHEDSVFSRLQIADPRTGDIAKFTTHDIRHWLNTIYQNGGLTEDQIALIFNRKYKTQNSIYDQTSSKVRTARLKQAVRDKVVIGQVTESYSRLADFSREEAEDYLTAVLRMVNPMPHGVCTLDWATTPCPHHLSCFSCNDELPCEHLVVDAADKAVENELERMQHESNLVLAAIEAQSAGDSPTVDHFKRIRRNVGTTLGLVRKANSEGEPND